MKTERFEMRLDPHMLQRIDAWRAEQPGMPSRAESMRRLADTGLAVLGQGSVRVSHGETLALMMLRDLYKHLKVKGEIDPEFVGEALWGGRLWGLEWKYTGLFHGDVDREEVVHEVVQILEMWSFIEFGYADLSDEERADVEKEVGPRGRDVRFLGFGGNHETAHLGIAGFLIDHLGRFGNFKERKLDSHMPSIEGYRRMYEVFEPMRQTLIGRGLSRSQIIALLKAEFPRDGEG